MLLVLPSKVRLQMLISVYAAHEQREVDGVDGDANDTHVLQHKEEDVAQPQAAQVRENTSKHLRFNRARSRHHLWKK